MKDLSKNKFTKVFTAFLGVAAALTLLAAFISCEQANKASVVNQTDNNKLTPPPAQSVQSYPDRKIQSYRNTACKRRH